jgi:K+-sensing histidine kinase KdpD
MDDMMAVKENLTTVLQSLDDDPALMSEIQQALEDTQHVTSCVNYIQQILSNTLDLTKLEIGAMLMNPQNARLGDDVLSPALDVIRHLTRETIQLKVFCASTLEVYAGRLMKV